MFCHVCGLQLPGGAQYCTRCGAQVASAVAPAAAAPAPAAPAVPSTAVPSAPAASALPAGIWRRFFNYLVDIVGIYLFQIVFGLVLGLAFGAATGSVSAGVGMVLSMITVLCSTFLYYLFFESIWQRSPGKWVTGTKVVMPDGSKPTFGRIAGRSALRYVPFEAFSFLTSKHPMGWHDRWSGTLVVPASYSEQDVQQIDVETLRKSTSSTIIVIIVAVLIVSVAVIGLLASIVLASLSVARAKGRDATRITDVKEIQLGLVLYQDRYGSYPASLSELAPTYISVLPVDPATGMQYDYYRCSPTLYHIGATLENASDLSMGKSAQSGPLCAGDPIQGSATQPCTAGDTGAACFDETSQS